MPASGALLRSLDSLGSLDSFCTVALAWAVSLRSPWPSLRLLLG